MKLKTKKLFWPALFIYLTTALIIQSFFLPSGGKESLIPYLAFPPMALFFLSGPAPAGIGLAFFMALVSGAFSALPIVSLFGLYLFFFFAVFLAKSLFFSKSPALFFILAFALSFLFPYLLDLAVDFSINDLSFFSGRLYFLKALSTAAFAFLIFPLLKKLFPAEGGF